MILFYKILASSVLLVALSGCFSSDDSVVKPVVAAAAQKSDTVNVSVDVVNYNHDYSYGFTLTDLSQGLAQEVNGGVVWPLASGGSKSCCLSLPLKWQAGLKVRLDWEESDYYHHTKSLKQEFEIAPYKEPGDLYVVFHTDHSVELVVSPAEPGSPQWAGKIKETPLTKCIGEHGKKECKRWLPNPEADYHNTCLHLKKDEDCQEILNFCKENPDDNHCVQNFNNQ